MSQEKGIQVDFRYIRDNGSQTDDDLEGLLSTSCSSTSSASSVFESEVESLASLKIEVSKKEGMKEILFCAFCHSTSETRHFYLSHNLKDASGNVLCPVLQKHICPLCYATGTAAHTINYCPFNLNKERNNKLRAGRNSVGVFKYPIRK